MKQNNINLGFLVPDMGIGGVETQVTLLVNEISKNPRFRVSLIIISKNLKHEISNRVKVFHVKANQGKLNKLKKVVSVLKFVKQQEIHYLHGFLGRGMEWTALLSLFSVKTKNIICFRLNLGQPNIFDKIWNKVFFSNAYKVLTNNKYVEENLPSRLGFNPNIVHYIPNGIFFKSEEVKVEYPKKINVFIIPASINSRKNQLLIIEGLGALSKHERKDIKVNMFGNADPKYLSKLYQKIEHYDISDIVSINKPKQDNLYNNSDAIILPSYYEGFPNVLLEAMKFGKVILISKQAEQNNIIKDGDNGFTFDAYNILEMKKAILESRNLTQNNIEKMCLINNRLIKKKFSIDKIVKHWEKLYN